jgi:allantoicase
MSRFDAFVDLANERLGGTVLAANDDFFAAKENLVLERAPVWKEDLYTDRGKWMDGWETRRRREPGHDWCLLRLGLPGVVRGLVVDTAFFRGNFPESFSLEGAELAGDPEPGHNWSERQPGWRELRARTPLAGDTKNEFAVDDAGRVTHLLLRIYPDGGVARLRVMGEVAPDPRRLAAGEVDLAAVENGGRVVDASDMFFGSRHNLIYPDPPRGMHDGWETKRRRGPGHDWAIVALGAAGTIHRAVVDTSHFKGNAPGACSLESSADGVAWSELLPLSNLRPHDRRTFSDLVDHAPARFVRFNIFPDGGVARLRLFGRVAAR